MLIFSIIIYTLFGFMCLWFIISGVQKIKQIRTSQEQAAQDKAEEKAKSNAEEADASEPAESDTTDQ